MDLHSLIRRLYAPEFMVKKSMQQAEFPGTKAAYSTAIGIAWASIAETFLISMISIADTLMVSTIGSEAIAAVGLCTQPRFIAQTLVFSINIAVASISARRKGEGDKEGAATILKQGLILSLAASLLFSLAFLPFAAPILTLVGAKADSLPYAIDYFEVIMLGIPVCSLSLTISAALRGTGNTQASMKINMTSNLVNVIFNYLLIGGHFGFPRLEVRGAAIATCIGWVSSLVLSIFFISRKSSYLYVFTRKGWRFTKQSLRAIFKVSSGSFGEQLCMRVGFLTNNIIIANLGTAMYATQNILISILNPSFSFGEGFGIAASSLVGQNLGAKRPDLSILYGKVCQRMSLISSTLIFIFISIFGRSMIGAFSQDPVIIATASSILILLVIIIFGQSSQMIFMGSLRGAGDTQYVAFISMICILILRPGLSFLFAYPLGMGLFGAWLAFVMDQAMRLFLTYRRFSSGKWVNIKL